MKKLIKSCDVLDAGTPSATVLTGVYANTQTVSKEESQLKEEELELRIDDAVEARYHNHRG
jgi:hypothetical protein